MRALLANRLFIGLAVGMAIGSLLGPPQRVIAQARTSVGSLQSMVEALVSGQTPAGDATKLGGMGASDYLHTADAAAFASVTHTHDVANLTGTIPLSMIPTTLSDRVLVFARIADSHEFATQQNEGALRYNSSTDKLEVSTGSQWRALQYEP